MARSLLDTKKYKNQRKQLLSENDSAHEFPDDMEIVARSTISGIHNSLLGNKRQHHLAPFWMRWHFPVHVPRSKSQYMLISS